MIKSALNRDTNRVKQQISSISEEAVALKLAMRRYPGNFKIEVPSRDAKTWGEPGCDQKTRVLTSSVWLHVVDHEAVPESGYKRDGAGGKRGDVSCIPFGALTKIEMGPDGEMRKVILEKGWVISRGQGKVKKRKAVAPVAQDGSEQPAKRITPYRGVSPQTATESWL